MAAGNSRNLGTREVESYVDTGNCKSLQITLGNAGVITTVTLPNEAKGFKMVPKTNNAYFAVNKTVETLATSSLQTIPASAFSDNGIAYSDALEIRLLPSGISRTIQIMSPVNATVVDLEVF